MPKARWSIGAAPLVCALLCTVSLGAASTEIIDRVLAVIAGQPILASDVSAAREFGLVVTDSPSASDREILVRLIDRALILAEAERYGPREPDANAVERKLEEVRARFPSSEHFAAALARTGLDERQVQERVRQELRIAVYLDQRFPVAAPTDDDVLAFYRIHPEQFVREGAPVPLEDARASIVQTIVTERRRVRVNEWLAGLRRRAQIVDLSGDISRLSGVP
jgi:hypothetical protein